LGKLLYPNAPKPGLVQPVSRDPLWQALLERAARGDETALPEVRRMFDENPHFAVSWGGLVGVAEDALVDWAAGSDLVVREGVKRRTKVYRTKLEAECAGEPSFLESLLITRVAHNWVTIHILETLSARKVPGSREAVALSRQLGFAERRLAGAIKALAVVRKHLAKRPAAVPHQSIECSGRPVTSS
jgi:hypothetical protein